MKTTFAIYDSTFPATIKTRTVLVLLLVSPDSRTNRRRKKIITVSTAVKRELNSLQSHPSIKLSRRKLVRQEAEGRKIKQMCDDKIAILGILF